MPLTKSIEAAIEDGVAALITAAAISGLTVMTADDGEEPGVPFAMVHASAVTQASDYSPVFQCTVRVSVYEASKQRSAFLGITWGAWKAARQTLFLAVRSVLFGASFKSNLAAQVPDIWIYEIVSLGMGSEPEGRKINNYTDFKINLKFL